MNNNFVLIFNILHFLTRALKKKFVNFQVLHQISSSITSIMIINKHLIIIF